MQIKTLRFNAYSNRECIGFDTLSNYDSYVVDTFDGVDFKPGDGVNTELILNIPTNHSNIDYLLAVEDGMETINSRWFILDCTRTRNGQYKLSLYRDTLYDYKAEIANSTAYIKRGWITDINNPLLLNQEDFQTNQVKMKESLLNANSDNVKTGPWIVGYLSKNAEGGKVGVRSPDLSVARALTDDEFKLFGGDIQNLGKTLAGYAVKSTASDSFYSSCEIRMVSGQLAGTAYDGYVGSKVDFINNTSNYYIDSKNSSSWSFATPVPFTDRAIEMAAYVKNNLSTQVGTTGLIQSRVISHAQEAGLLDNARWGSVDGQKFSYGDQIYTAHVESSGTYRIVEFKLDSIIASTNIANLMNASDKIVEHVNGGNAGIYIYAAINTLRVTFSPDLTYTYSVDIPNNFMRSKAGKAPYDIFAMSGNVNEYYQLAQAISAKYSGSGALYDLQLVPYININNSRTSSISGGSGGTMYWLDPAANQEASLAPIVWTDNPMRTATTAVAAKEVNQTKLVRLVSPSRQSVFEFNPARAGLGDQANGVWFTLRFTLKPYNPVFAIVPDYSKVNSLYSRAEFTKDSRGLICGDDFSLPQTNDSWETYQINNKNYLNAFNRQIESVELNNKYAHEQDVARAISGTVSAAVSAGTAGFATGGVAGAAVGALVGGTVSGLAGARDVQINEKLRTDQLDLQKDMFNFNLQNIQAQPTTLAKIGAYDALNKLIPFIEYYDCTDKEKSAFRNYLKYRGMSINTLDTISAYKRSGHFVQADIVHIDLHEDQHLINTIREEVSKGFFDGHVANV